MNFNIFPTEAKIPNTKCRVKFGVDPTGDQLHLGHLIPLKIVKELKDKGHQIDIILGTFTAQIGDATGRDTTRPILTSEQTNANAIVLLEQVKRILGDDINIHHNSDWHNLTTLTEILNIMAKFSVQKLLNRDNFAIRMEENIPIGMHELMGPILQGIDSFKLQADVEVGGNDQLFNFSISREIQTILGQKPEICIMAPIINGLDGRKMSKTFGNCIFINDTPENVFGKVMSISDNTMHEWQLVFFDEIDSDRHPMIQKKELALKITTDIWGEELANNAMAHFESVIQSRKLPENIPEFELGNIIDIVANITNGSKSSTRRLFESNAVSVNGEKIGSIIANSFKLKSGDILKVGKLKYAKII